MSYFYEILSENKHASRWLVILIDLSIVAITFILTYFIRFNFSFNFNPSSFNYQIPIVLLVALFSFLITGSYKGIVRHTGVKDALKVGLATLLISFILGLYSALNHHFEWSAVKFPKLIIFIHFMLTLFVLIVSRFIFKSFYHALVLDVSKRKNILIYGAGDSGLITYMALSNDANKHYVVRGFIDDNKKLKHKNLKGLPIIMGYKLNQEIIDQWHIDEIIISIQNIENTELLKIVERLIKYKVKVKTTPPVNQWIDGTLQSKQIREVKVEDLLNRTQIEIFNDKLEQSLHDKTILVTGAAGSIGGEICKQLAQYSCKKLLFVDQAESPLYDIQMDLKKYNHTHIDYIIADVSNRNRMEKIFTYFDIDYIFHAAAYKHVPMMEDNPYEAINVNILGSKNLMDLAVEYQVGKFVMVSTDKAVNPTNVMGATKRAAELYAQIKNREGKTKFVTTRFGNVLGSNGSVIPLFKKQIEKGGPLTVTHKDIYRYFMTIPEACQLVLEAGVMGEGGEIFVFDMGESVRIFDLAKNMIRLSNYDYPEDIDIEITGLRPGEKLYEELLHNSETTIPTHHPKIMKAKKGTFDYAAINEKIERFYSIDSHDNMALIKNLKSIVQEYKSQNSVFERLDESSDN
ncbi:MAG: polysaccharide biosynthesis protein [Flavobacteriia bacterium]|nr:MAG: polysaccharide biosynthesis protein [Flavobacteriia bacterium]